MKVAECLEAVHTHTHHYLQNCVSICYAYNAMVEFVYSTAVFTKIGFIKHVQKEIKIWKLERRIGCIICVRGLYV